MNNPKISVVTVCYNAVSIIEDTILSVINQNYQNIEYIIIDGGSKDGTVDIIKKYADRIAYWISEPDRGIYDAMNKGIAVASGDYINFMNAGDKFVDAEVLKKVVSQINPESTIVYGDTLMDYKYWRILRTNPPIEDMAKVMVNGHQASFIKTDYHKQHPYDTSFKSSGDYDFFYNAYFKYGVSFQYMPVTVVLYEAEQGMSARNLRTVAYEDARIHGIKINFAWKMKTELSLEWVNIKKIIKSLLPRKIIFKHLKSKFPSTEKK